MPRVRSQGPEGPRRWVLSAQEQSWNPGFLMAGLASFPPLPPAASVPPGPAPPAPHPLTLPLPSQNSSQFMKHTKRRKLTVEDFNRALRWSSVEVSGQVQGSAPGAASGHAQGW